jgi:Secretion system C-terminal sorting domain
MKYTLLIAILSCGMILSAQTYSLDASIGTYSDLVGATSLNKGEVWDDPDYEIPFGFTFDLFGKTLTNIYIDDFGLGAYLTHTSVDTGVKPLIIAYGADIIDRGFDVDHSVSEISYMTVGSSGSKILKIEWKNFGFWGDLDDDGVTVDSANLQIWFYEGTNTIEMRFGPNAVTQPNIDYEGLPGPYMGLVEQFDFSSFGLVKGAAFVKGDPSSPTLSNSDTSLAFLNGNVPNGAIYRFYIPRLNSVEDKSIDFQVYPNPVSNMLFISSREIESGTVEIRNTTGVTMRKVELTSEPIEVSDLASGLYVVEIESAGRFARKLIFIE